MSLYLGNNLISGAEQFVGESRNIGQIIQSLVPLTDAGLHLLDGALIQGGGIYNDFVDYIADLYTANPTASYFMPEEAIWTQPTLSANGTMGGNDYACAASSTESGYDAWKAFDNDNSTRWGSSSDALPDWITFYSPVGLKVSNVYLDFYSNSEIYSAGTIQGSNDNSTWTTLASFSGNSSLTINIPISTNSFYKYIRFNGTALYSNGWGKVAIFKITATQSASAEEAWQAQVLKYGACGKFVYDSTNNTVRLPKITGIIEGTVDVNALGDLVQAGLPNITGDTDYAITDDQNYQPSGAFYRQTSSKPKLVWASGSTSNDLIAFNASNSNTIYGNSQTVQPQTIKAFYYIVIANSTKTEIQVDIDEIATDLNSKADVDLTNCTKPHIVETYVNGESGYNLYSNGYIEQWGIAIKPGQGANSFAYATASLLKEMANANYNVSYCGLADGGSTYELTQNICSRTTSTVGIGFYSTVSCNDITVAWRVCGYIN